MKCVWYAYDEGLLLMQDGCMMSACGWSGRTHDFYIRMMHINMRLDVTCTRQVACFLNVETGI